MKDRIALITGATSGIGKATATKLARNNFNVIITGRRKERLDKMAEEIKKATNSDVYVLHFDVRDKEQVETAIDSLPEEWKNINVLINNAGLAVGLNHIHEGEIDDWERMIDTNVKGLLYMTRKIAPLMAAKQKGHILNIGSTAGKEVYENGNVYCSTKHAVDALTKAMRIDMLKDKIKVTAVNPGMVETEFSEVRFKGDKEKAKKVYQGFTPLFGEDIAEVILFALNAPDHVCLNDITMTSLAQANSYYKITQ